ncbi:MAG: type III-A CRISPR-associated RAMP protein Csm5 [Syntrophobacterales bacterium]|nr:type III-A CRISPR-associated RAMP protein Csm5 [Syntrophobacterales bacterium]
MNEETHFIIRILAPVHIGCDEVYEPTGFVLDETSCTLTAFHPVDFVRHLSKGDLDRLTSICRRGDLESILDLYKFMKGKSAPGHKVEACKGLIEHYQKTLSIGTRDRNRIQQELNKFTISRTSFHPVTQQPYIPGTAVKGALRTAYLDGRQQEKQLARIEARRGIDTPILLEKALLDGGSFETDPFRLLKVSDFQPVGPYRTRIVFAVNEKKRPSRFAARGPYQILEVIEPGAVFSGTVQILPPPTNEIIRTPLTKTSLFDSVRTFYAREKYREDQELADISIPRTPVGDNKGLLMRLGRHSGAECLTIQGQRRIRIMQGRGNPPTFSEEGATTFWLAADSSTKYDRRQLRPFGWATLEEATAELLEAIMKTAKVDTMAKPDRESKDSIPSFNVLLRQIIIDNCMKA